MGYYVSRNGQQSGPYEEAVVRQYLAEGSLFPSDHAREASSPTWTTLGALFPGLGIAVPPPTAAPVPSGPTPPSLHWALVLLFACISCGLFTFVWVFVQASFVRKIVPGSKAMVFYILWLISQVAYMICYVRFLSMAMHGSEIDPSAAGGLGGVMALVGVVQLVFWIIASFSTRASLVQYYNTVEPIGLRLSGVMTFFFSILYFQHHFSRIAAYKTTGYLSPQS